MARIVMKFGGTSVADIGRIRNVARHVKREVDAGHEVAVVVSAMAGKTNELVGWVQGRLEGRGLQPQHLRCARIRRRGRLGRAGDVGAAGARAAVDRHRRALLAGLADPDQDRQRAWRRAHPGDRRHDADRAVQDRPGGGHLRFPGHRAGQPHRDARPRRLRYQRRRHRGGGEGRPLRHLYGRRRRLHHRSAHRAEGAALAEDLLRGNARNGLARRQGAAGALGRACHGAQGAHIRALLLRGSGRAGNGRFPESARNAYLRRG